VFGGVTAVVPPFAGGCLSIDDDHLAIRRLHPSN